MMPCYIIVQEIYDSAQIEACMDQALSNTDHLRILK